MGYIKRTPLSEFREQARGGVGAKGARTRDNDFTEYIYPATMHQTMLFFTKKGRCYWLKCYEIPDGDRNSKGRAIQNMLNIEPDDSVNACLRLRGLNDEEFLNSHYVIFATKQGVVKKTCLEAYSRPRTNGVIAININEGDEVVDVRLTNGHNELIMADRNGRACRFDENTIRTMGRVATGVRGMRLDEGDDEVVGMIVVNDAETESVMVVSENGYGKRSEVEDYRKTNRGGKGVKTLNITEKTGRLVAIKNVTDQNDLMIINKSGIAIRLAVSECRVMGRATQGVRLINLTKKNDVIASVCKVMSSELEAQVEEENRMQQTANTEVMTSGATSDDNIQNENMIFPPEIYHKVLPIDKSSSLADTKDVSIVHFLNSPTKPWQMSDEEFEQHWGKHECMKQYKKCLDAVREKKNKLKKLIETSKLLMNQEIENINKSLGI